jgi:hypothetical protein
LKKLNEEKKLIKAMVCFLPLTLVFAREPFSIFFERKRGKNKYYGLYVQMPNPPQNPY